MFADLSELPCCATLRLRSSRGGCVLGVAHAALGKAYDGSRALS
jgi:hypothetical protein